MKMFLPVASAAVLFALGVVVGARLNRYEHVTVSDYPARFDRWSGKLELVKISMTQEWLNDRYAAKPSATSWPGTPVPSK